MATADSRLEMAAGVVGAQPRGLPGRGLALPLRFRLSQQVGAGVCVGVWGAATRSLAVAGAAFYKFLPLGLEQQPLESTCVASQVDPGSNPSCVALWLQMVTAGFCPVVQLNPSRLCKGS